MSSSSKYRAACAVVWLLASLIALRPSPAWAQAGPDDYDYPTDAPAPLPPPPMPSAPSPDPPAPPVQQQPAPPPAAAPAPAVEEEPGFWDELIEDRAAMAGVLAAGGGVVGSASVCGLVALSPLCCGLPFGAPIGALTLGLSAAVGAAFMSDWSCAQSWIPPIVGVFIGGAAGLLASITGMAVASAMGMTMGGFSWDPTSFATATLFTASVAGLSAGAVMLLGAAGTGLATTLLFNLGEELSAQPAKPERKKKPKRRARPKRQARSSSSQDGGGALVQTGTLAY